MRVEHVPGERREVLHVLQRHHPRARGHRVPRPQLGERLAERVPAVQPPRRATDPAAGHRGEHPRAGLDGGALHVVQHAADAAHLLAAAGPPRSAVHQHGQRRPVAGGLGAVVSVQHEEPAVHALVAASAGNHGRAVAHVAAQRGLRARIFLPARALPARRAAIEGEDAEVVVVDGTYEDAVARSQAAGREPGAMEIADVGESGPAHWVVDGRPDAGLTGALGLRDIPDAL